MKRVIGQLWMLALVSASVFAMTTGCGEQFVSTGGTGGDGGSGAGGGGPCSDGDTQKCYTGPSGTLGNGICASGSQTCKDGIWGVCSGDVTPGTETCDGLDNNCDGETDEVCPCEAGDYCYPYSGTAGEGPCKSGSKVCDGNVLIECKGAVGPGTEICDGIDNDCDGTVDNVTDAGNACQAEGMGACKVGELHCNTETMVLECKAVNEPTDETCDGVDNDCDGQIDETFPGIGDTCTTMVSGTTCTGKKECINSAQGCIPRSPYFTEPFSGNTPKFSTSGAWGIGPAVQSSGQSMGSPDPAMDTTATTDNRLAGTVIGGNIETMSLDSYLTSDPIDLSQADGTIFLSFQSWLNSDGVGTIAFVEVWNGTTWMDVWSNEAQAIFNSQWTTRSIDVSMFKSADFKVRFGLAATLTTPKVSGWSVDDIGLSSCPQPGSDLGTTN